MTNSPRHRCHLKCDKLLPSENRKWDEVAVTSLADQAGRGGPIYFCWLDCHRGQQLLPLDTDPPHSERDLAECMRTANTWLYSPDTKRHQLVKSLLTMPFVWGLNKIKKTSRWGEPLSAYEAASRQSSLKVTKAAEKHIFNHLRRMWAGLMEFKITWNETR